MADSGRFAGTVRAADGSHDASNTSGAHFSVFAARASYNFLAEAASKDILARISEPCEWKHSFGNVAMDASFPPNPSRARVFKSMLISRVTGGKLTKLLTSAALRMQCNIGSHRFEAIDEYQGHTVLRVQSHTVDKHEPVDSIVMQTCHYYEATRSYLFTVCAVDHPSAPPVKGCRRLKPPCCGVLVSPMSPHGPQVVYLIAQIDTSVLFSSYPKQGSSCAQSLAALPVAVRLPPASYLPVGAGVCLSAAELTAMAAQQARRTPRNTNGVSFFDGASLLAGGDLVTPIVTSDSQPSSPAFSSGETPSSPRPRSSSGASVETPRILWDSMLLTSFVAVTLELQTKLTALEVAAAVAAEAVSAPITPRGVTTFEPKPSAFPPTLAGTPRHQLHRVPAFSDVSETTALQDSLMGMALSSPAYVDNRAAAAKRAAGLPVPNGTAPQPVIGAFPNVVSPTAAGPKKKQRGGMPSFSQVHWGGQPLATDEVDVGMSGEAAGAGSAQRTTEGGNPVSSALSPIMSPRTAAIFAFQDFAEDEPAAESAGNTTGVGSHSSGGDGEARRSMSPLISPRLIDAFWAQPGITPSLDGLGDLTSPTNTRDDVAMSGSGAGATTAPYAHTAGPQSFHGVLDPFSNIGGVAMPAALGVRSRLVQGVHLAHRRISSEALPSTSPAPIVTGMPPFHRRVASMEASPVSASSPAQNRRISTTSDLSRDSNLVSSPGSMGRSPAILGDDGGDSCGSRTPTSQAPYAPAGRACAKCGVTETPKWRKDKSNPASLLYYCNACGLQMMKKTRGGHGRGSRANSAGSGAVPLDIPSALEELPSSSLVSPIQAGPAGKATPQHAHDQLGVAMPSPLAPAATPGTKSARRMRAAPQLKVNVEGANDLGSQSGGGLVSNGTASGASGSMPSMSSSRAASGLAAALLMGTPTGSSGSGSAPVAPNVSDQFSPSILASMSPFMDGVVPSPKLPTHPASATAGAAKPTLFGRTPVTPTGGFAGSLSSAVPPNRRPSDSGRRSAGIPETAMRSLLASEYKKRPAGSPRQTGNVVIAFPASGGGEDQAPAAAHYPSAARRYTPRGEAEKQFDMFHPSPKASTAPSSWNWLTNGEDGDAVMGSGHVEGKRDVGAAPLPPSSQYMHMDFNDSAGNDDIDYDLLNSIDL